MTVFIWSLTALSLVGVILNIFKQPACFVIWILTNACWALITLGVARGRLKPVSVLPMFPLYVTYFALAWWGFLKW